MGLLSGDFSPWSAALHLETRCVLLNSTSTNAYPLVDYMVVNDRKYSLDAVPTLDHLIQLLPPDWSHSAKIVAAYKSICSYLSTWLQVKFPSIKSTSRCLSAMTISYVQYQVLTQVLKTSTVIVKSTSPTYAEGMNAV